MNNNKPCRCKYCLQGYDRQPIDTLALNRLDALITAHKRHAEPKRFVAPTLPNLTPVTRGIRKRSAPGAIMLSANGETLSITQWGKKLGIPYTTLRKTIGAGMALEAIIEARAA